MFDNVGNQIGSPNLSTYFQDNGADVTFNSQNDQFSQIMLAFMSQAGVADTATGMVDKAKFTKYMNDTQALQNQLDSSTWGNMKTMADAWAR